MPQVPNKKKVFLEKKKFKNLEQNQIGTTSQARARETKSTEAPFEFNLLKKKFSNFLN
jgi:hypothetical protein